MSNEQRLQQIRDAARYKYPDERIHFIDGAKWADQHPAWIPVEKELPEKDGRYWCCDDDDGQEELRWRDGHWYGLLDPYPIEGVTHWMSLPTPPQRKEAKNEQD